MAARTKPHVEMTVRQRYRVQKHAHLPYAIAKAVCFSPGFGDRCYDIAVSIGDEVLCDLARNFSHQKTPSREKGFGPYAVKWMKKTVRAKVIREMGKEFTFTSVGVFNARPVEDHLVEGSQKVHTLFRKKYSRSWLGKGRKRRGVGG